MRGGKPESEGGGGGDEEGTASLLSAIILDLGYLFDQELE
tara:strand:+ start:339 stop:458 length:120 start_codon:yes stop_codon:yes gene_type:complete